MTNAAPRIYCIRATAAPVVAVFRRGPSQWSHVGRWDLARGRYEPGAWVRARIFPRRCDVSPDGRLLCTFVHQPRATWEHGETYVALSRLPWVKALRAFGTCGTYDRGCYFTANGSNDDPQHNKLPMRYGLRAIPVGQFANERRQGWEEAPDSPARDPADTWDQRRNARMQRRQPQGKRLLRVESLGSAGGELGGDLAVDGLRVRYSLESGEHNEILDDVQWADWDNGGRLLLATRDGRLQIRMLRAEASETVFEEHLAQLIPEPRPAPGWAGCW